MTEPQPVMEQAEQDRLTRQVGRALLTVAGQDWTQVRAEYRSAGRHVEVDVFVSGPDGQPRPVRPPQEVVEGLGRLRQGMYRPGRGTWLSALYLLDPPSSFSAEFEPDVEPRWRRTPPPIGFADELRFFPRADEHIPDWFRQRAGLPPATGEQPATPPSGQPTHQAGPQSGQSTPPGGQPAQPGHPTPPGGQTVQPGHPSSPGGQPTPPRGQPALHGHQPGQPMPPGVQPTPPEPTPSGPPAHPTPPGGQRHQGYRPPAGPQQSRPNPPGGQPQPGQPALPPGPVPHQPTPPGGVAHPGESPHASPHGTRRPHPGTPPFGQPGAPTQPPDQQAPHGGPTPQFRAGPPPASQPSW